MSLDVLHMLADSMGDTVMLIGGPQARLCPGLVRVAGWRTRFLLLERCSGCSASVLSFRWWGRESRLDRQLRHAGASVGWSTL